MKMNKIGKEAPQYFAKKGDNNEGFCYSKKKRKFVENKEYGSCKSKKGGNIF